MKKILALTLCAALCLAFTACIGPIKQLLPSTDFGENTAVISTTAAEEYDETNSVEDEKTQESTISLTPTVPEAPLVDSDIVASSAKDAAKGIEQLLASLKAGDAETIISLSGSDAAREDELLLEMLVALFGQLEYKVGEVKVTSDTTATLPVEIKAVSITSVFTEYMVEAAKHIDDDNWDADGAEFIKICRSNKVSKETTNVDVKLVCGADGVWTRGAENEAFIEALFGGLI